jgi:hypothetical protein
MALSQSYNYSILANESLESATFLVELDFSRTLFNLVCIYRQGLFIVLVQKMLTHTFCGIGLWLGVKKIA